jgi:hypothetical protein
MVLGLPGFWLYPELPGRRDFSGDGVMTGKRTGSSDGSSTAAGGNSVDGVVGALGLVLLVVAVAIPQMVLGLIGSGDGEVTLAIWGLLAMVLAGTGLLVLAAVLAEVYALLLAVGRFGAGIAGILLRRLDAAAGSSRSQWFASGLPAKARAGGVVGSREGMGAVAGEP